MFVIEGYVLVEQGTEGQRRLVFDPKMRLELQRMVDIREMDD